MKKILFLFLILVSSLCCNLFSWDTTASKYMPLQIGNVWVYYDHYAPPYPYSPSSSLVKYRITGTIDTLGKRYYVFQETIVPIIIGYTCRVPYLTRLRIDSGTMNLYEPGLLCNSNGIFVDSLLSRKNDRAYVCPQGDYHQCYDTSLYPIFNGYFPSKTIQGSHNPLTIYAIGLGIVKFEWAELMNTCIDTLVGCVINGVLRGDTSMIVGLQNISSESLGSFSLSQNYPNPFNPKTVIRFQVAGDKFVTLKIFDALGKEVETLFIQQLMPGTYEADWDGTNYPSGVYFYQLSVGNEQLATKKMVLIK